MNNYPQPSTPSTETNSLKEHVLRLSEKRGWEALQLSPAETVRGEENWRRFVEKATADRLTRACEALEGAT